MAILCTPVLWAQNAIQTVEQVTGTVELATPVDYVITGTTPIVTTGSVDIQNDDAVLIFLYVRPATVKSSYLSRVKINGTKATSGQNCWVEIYKNGTIVYPHKETDFKPLTVYYENNFEGEPYNNFTPYTKYTSGEWVDQIKSFRLKRGYMATIGTNASGQGWSKCFIAQDADLNIDFSKVAYGKYISGKAGFIRVFPWRNVTKKGTGGSPGNRHRELNTTWMYGWNGDGWHDDYVEHIPQHHHEGWPSWGGINGLNTCNTVLGNNEPDNQGDDREQPIPVADIESRLFGPTGSWQNEAYTGGLRVGSPAMSGDARGSWLSTFMNLAEQYNCRIDFIADHCYWHDPASSYTWQMNETYNKYHRPIWITEFNYGANWTAWESSDHSGSDANQTIELNNIRSIVTALENNTHVERYAFYNWVEDCRALVFDKVTRDSQGNVISTETILTKTFYWYRDLMSNSAYDPINEYTMGWTYSNPSDLKATLLADTKEANLTWKHPNAKQTDSIHIERQVGSSGRWTSVGTIEKPNGTILNFRDNLQGVKGLIKYRINDFDSDGKQRTSGVASISVAGADGSSFLQFGSLTINDATEKTIPFEYEMEEKPAVFFGLSTYNNANLVMEPYIKNSTITTTGFKFTPLAWRKQAKTGTFTANEAIPFMAIPFGNYHFDGMDIEVGSLQIKRDTLDVEFVEPFPEGVTPIVIASANGTTDSNRPLMHKIWNITNTGFRIVAMYEDGEFSANGIHIRPSVNQHISYLAVTPGDACVDPDAGTFLAAGYGQKEVVTPLPSEEYFRRSIGDTEEEAYVDTLKLVSPILFCETQTKNLPTPSVLRVRGYYTVKENDPDTGEKVTYTTGFKVRRVVDESVTSGIDNAASGTADQVAWVALHTNPVFTPTGINHPVIESTYSGDELNVRVVNRIVYVTGHPQFELFTAKGTRAASNATQAPGVYIVRAGGKVAKITVK